MNIQRITLGLVGGLVTLGALIIVISMASDGGMGKNLNGGGGGDIPVACTEEAKQCPDGSYVGRTGPNCAFAECKAGSPALMSPGGDPVVSTPVPLPPDVAPAPISTPKPTPKPPVATPPDAGVNPQESQKTCVGVGGTLDEQFKECLGIGAKDCSAIGGTFNECASACRNDPGAEMCTMQCVQVCSVK